MPYVIDDVCPIECCTFGPWVANTRLKVRTAPRSEAPVAFYIGPGSHFEAVTGQLHISQFGLVVARRATTVEDEVAGKLLVARGDTMLVLGYRGDDVFEVWRRGRQLAIPAFWPAPELGSAQGDMPGEVLRPMLSRWWVKVRQGRRTGWLEMTEAVDVSGHDDVCS
jgi:hypothetical protein